MAESCSNYSVDWSKCVLCQIYTSEKLRCPFESKQKDAYSWYDTLCCNIRQFYQLKCSPYLEINKLLMENEDLTRLFIENQAKWHKSCRNMFNNQQLERTKKRKTDYVVIEMSDNSDENVDTERVMKLPRSINSTKTSPSCFFCDRSTGVLHQASTLNLDRKVRESANLINDTLLLAKLSAGDMIALDAMYHTPCLTRLYARASRVQSSQDPAPDHVAMCEGISLAELVSFIEDTSNDSDTNPVRFTLSELTKLYVSRLEQMGVDVGNKVHSTRLKSRLLEQCPNLQCYKDGREVVLVNTEHVASFLRKQSENYGSDAMTIYKAANIIRQDLFTMEKSQFEWKFVHNCQENSVPQSLRTLVGMILYGTCIKTQLIHEVENQANLSISQLIKYNSCIRRRKDSQKTTFHSKQRESPLPIYIGLLLHGETRKRGLVDKLNNLGLSISYNRVLEISTDLGNRVCERFEAENISSLLPLFQEEAKSVAMILHSMNTVNRSVQFLNPGQIPVVACDQPLYAFAKKIQWQWPETHGVEKYVIMLGRLHTEMAALRTLGDWLEGSGWKSAITQANIASAGTVDSFHKAKHVSRTRHAHQVTACSLHILMSKAYDEYVQGISDEQKLDLHQWQEHKSSTCPQFKYWGLTLKFQLWILLFVQSLSEGRFDLYRESSKHLLPWFFALDHCNTHDGCPYTCTT